MQVSGAISDVLVALPSTGCHRAPEFKNYFSPFSDSKNSFYKMQSLSSLYVVKLAIGLDKSKTRGYKLRAYENSGENNMAPIAPVHMESPAGQQLAHMLKTQPHLVPAAIDQLLELLQIDREGQEREPPSPTQNRALYRRIAEVRKKDRRTTLEDLIYCSIAHRFVENNIKMIPKISQDSIGRVDFWQNQEKKLVSVHSAEAFYMIQNHLSDLLGNLGSLRDPVESSNIELGKMYAESTIYGYFLRRVNRRYQLELTMKTLPKEFGKSMNPSHPAVESPWWDPDSVVQIPADADTASFEPVDASHGESFQLESYVKYILDAATLKSYATIRSNEALSLIEKQTQALFGRPDIKEAKGFILEVNNEKPLCTTVGGARNLVLEAVTFGSLLWDAEDHAESKYSFVSS